MLRGQRGDGGDAPVAEKPRSWPFSVIVALAVVGVGVTLSATINPLLDRRVHWDWTAVLATALLLFFSTALRRRWI